MARQVRLWLLELFEKYQGFRRIVFIYVAWLTAYLSIESMALITLAVTYKTSLLELAGAFAAVYGLHGALVAFIAKLYWDGRNMETK